MSLETESLSNILLLQLQSYSYEICTMLAFSFGYVFFNFMLRKTNKAYRSQNNFKQKIAANWEKLFRQELASGKFQISKLGELMQDQQNLDLVINLLETCEEYKLKQEAQEILSLVMKSLNKFQAQEVLVCFDFTFKILAQDANLAPKISSLTDFLKSWLEEELRFMDIQQIFKNLYTILKSISFSQYNLMKEAEKIFQIIVENNKCTEKYYQSKAILIRGYCKHLNPKIAYQMFQQLAQSGHKVCTSVLNDLLICFYKKNEMSLCQEIAEFILTQGHVKLNKINYLYLMKAYNKLRNPEKVKEIFQKCLDNVAIKKNISLFNAVLKCCSTQSSLLDTIQYFKLLRDLNIKCSVKTFNYVMEGVVVNFTDQKKMSLIWEFYQMIQKDDLKPDSYTFHLLVKGLKECKGNEEDLQKIIGIVLDTEQNFELDVKFYNQLLDICVLYQKMDQTLQIWSRMKENGKLDEISYNVIIKGYSLGNQWQQAKLLFQEMQERNLKATIVTYNSLIEVYVQACQLDEAWDLFQQMEQSELTFPDCFTLSTLIKGFSSDKAQKSQFQERFEKLILLTNQYRNAKKIIIDSVLYNCVINGLIKYRQLNRAIQIFNEMKKENKQTEVTYSILIKAFGWNQQNDKALELFNEMRLQGIQINHIVIGNILDSCVKCNDTQTAEQIFSQVVQQGLQPNSLVYTVMITCYTKQRQLEKAISLYESLTQVCKNENTKVNTITTNAILDCCIKCKKLKIAQDMFSKIQQDDIFQKPDLISYSTLLKGYCQDNQLSLAFCIFEQMKENLQKEGMQLDQVIFNTLMEGCFKTQQYEKLFSTYQEMIDVFNLQPTEVTYSILIKTYSRQNQFDQALECWKQMKDRNMQIGLIVYSCLIQPQIKTQKYYLQALEILNEMMQLNIKGDAVLYKSVLKGCMYKKDYLNVKNISLYSIQCQC